MPSCLAVPFPVLSCTARPFSAHPHPARPFLPFPVLLFPSLSRPSLASTYPFTTRSSACPLVLHPPDEAPRCPVAHYLPWSACIPSYWVAHAPSPVLDGVSRRSMQTGLAILVSVGCREAWNKLQTIMLFLESHLRASELGSIYLSSLQDRKL